MLSSEEQLKALEIIDVCRLLYGRNLLAAADGNVSCIGENDRILMTPSGRPKRNLSANEIAIVKLNGEVVFGEPSSEMIMHLEVYRSCPEAKAVVHAHPPTAIAWTVSHPEMKELPAAALSELILAVGRLPIAPYARPGTQAMGEVLKPFLPDHRALILSRHGALCWGESLTEALMGMERIEHVSEILYKAETLKGLTELPSDEIEVLKQMRKKIGPQIL